ncbi:Serine protease gd [Harpegnathos saltator]|uniref:Serine protease gd n=2 Tax=Harpegnathos saltator TaxID=610380 RepID=E2BCT1_HARSA|nr:Serine protease gd [Harpegnathos saltator]
MTYIPICGGSLIRNNLVVSVAHCFEQVLNNVNNASSYAVVAGKHYRAWNADEQYSQKSLVENIEVGERYLGLIGNYASDIALLKLKTPFELNMLVRPICIDWEIIYERALLQPGQLGKMVTWNENINDESNQTMYEVVMQYVPNKQCVAESPIDFRRFITQDKFCAGRLNDSSIFIGQSGNGLYIHKNGTWYLRGIASIRYGNVDDNNSYIGFTYISHFRDWIHEAYDSA